MKNDIRVRFDLSGTGDYRTVRGHHPTAKKAFEGDVQYNYNDAFSVSIDALNEAWKKGNLGVPQNIHSNITGKQNSFYSAWKNNNPGKKLTLDEMADIEIRAMTEAGIPNDIARGWVIKALENLQAQGVTRITNIPWNGLN